MNSFQLTLLGLVAAAATTVAAGAAGQGGASARQLTHLSLEELLRLEVSAVSRKVEDWWSSPGAVDVVTDEDIRRSGIFTLPDALRLATGVHVGQANAREWAVAIRGFNVNSSNKLNVQIDGRSLFTPFFSGVLWDAQDTLLEDISRIEVVRGPAGALWGAYAVNGFIQIVTKPAWETQGWLSSAATGTDLPLALAVRYGGKLSPSAYYRAYAKYTQFKWTYAPGTDRRAQPETDLVQAGFRADVRGAGGGTFTLQGDAYTNKGTPKDRFQNEASGANVTMNLLRVLAADSDFRAGGYFDYTEKDLAGTFRERRHTLAGSVKHRFTRGAHELQAGVDGLVSWDEIQGTGAFLRPSKETYYTASLFAQDTIALVPQRWSLTAGGQVLYTRFADFDVQPTIRLLWRGGSRTTAWTALSRAVRPPVRLDRDLVTEFNGSVVFAANNDVKSESVVSWEVGGRHKFGERLAISAAAFVNDYDNVRSYESATPVFMALPWTFKNTTNVHSWGVETTLLAQPTSRVFIKGSYRYLDLELTRDPGSGDFMNAFFEANDPRHVAQVTARVDLKRGVEADVTLRHASRLPNPPMKGFTTMDLRLAWTFPPYWELALIGRNLLDRRHPEFTTANHPNDEVGRSVTFKATWRF